MSSENKKSDAEEILEEFQKYTGYFELEDSSKKTSTKRTY